MEVESEVSSDACPICSQSTAGVVDVCVTSCGHRYHLHCMMEWTRTQGTRQGTSAVTCPLCRTGLLDARTPRGHLSTARATAGLESLVGVLAPVEEGERDVDIEAAVQAATVLMGSIHEDTMAETSRTLTSCVRSGDLAGVEMILGVAPYMVNYVGQDGMTPLHHAAAVGRTGMISSLISNRARIREKTAHGLTPLHLAVHAKSLACVTLLLASGANVDDVDGAGETPAFTAVRLADRSVLIMLFMRGADVNARNHAGETLLHVAAKNSSAWIHQTLAAYVPNLERADALGNTPLHVAVSSGNVAFLDQFMSRIAYAERFRANSLGKTPENIVSSGTCEGLKQRFRQWSPLQASSNLFRTSDVPADVGRR